MADSLQKVKEKNVEIIMPDLAEFKEATAPMKAEYAQYGQTILDYIDKARNPE